MLQVWVAMGTPMKGARGDRDHKYCKRERGSLRDAKSRETTVKEASMKSL